jgi:hypothetical protein
MSYQQLELGADGRRAVATSAPAGRWRDGLFDCEARAARRSSAATVDALRSHAARAATQRGPRPAFACALCCPGCLAAQLLQKLRAPAGASTCAVLSSLMATLWLIALFMLPLAVVPLAAGLVLGARARGAARARFQV